MARVLGETFGSYRVLGKLGEGGMGAVYLAEHTLLGKKVAIKVLLPELSSHPDIVTRFFNEARAATLLKHPGVVDVFDFGHAPGASAYIVMEYLEGESLAARIRSEGRLEPALAVEVARQIAGALTAAHERGIVHRDLKPDNVFLVGDRDLPFGLRVKVLDFGIAKLAGAEAQPGVKTRTGALMGTPLYMSPEQCRGAGQVDHRSDIYSLGCMLFEMASGRPPYNGEGPGDVIAMHLTAELPALDASTPPRIRAIVTRALAKKPEGRFATMAEMNAELEEARTLGPVRAAAPSPAALDATVSGKGPTTTLSRSVGQLRPAPPAAGGRRIVVAASVAIALTAGAGYFLFFRVPPSASHVVSELAASATAGSAPPTVASAAPVAAPFPTVTAEPPRAATVRLAIDSVPSGADVIALADGLRVGRTPLALDRARAGGEAAFVLKLPGYEDAPVSLSASQDGARRIVLAPLPSRQRARRAKPTAAPAAAKAPTKPVANGVVDAFGN